MERGLFSSFLSSDLFYRYASDPAAQAELAFENEASEPVAIPQASQSQVLASSMSESILGTSYSASHDFETSPIRSPESSASHFASSIDQQEGHALRHTYSDHALSTKSVKSDDDEEDEEDEGIAPTRRLQAESLENSATVAAVESALQNILQSRDSPALDDGLTEGRERRASMFAYDHVEQETDEVRYLCLFELYFNMGFRSRRPRLIDPPATSSPPMICCPTLRRASTASCKKRPSLTRS